MTTCSQCGGQLGEGKLTGLCPQCMLLGALTEEPDLEFGGLEEVDDASLPQTLPAPEIPPLARFGDYELLEEIAHGGMGVVYRARQVKLDRIVAIKMILLGQRASAELQQRFQREAQAAAHLHHPGIVAIHEVGEVEGQPFFSMDFIEGKNLAQMLEGKPLSARQAATYTKSIAEAVHFAHQQGVIHRDLKPSNVLVDFAENRVHLTDFGLARRLEQDSDLTLTGQVLGSPNHMAPELAAGQHQRVGPRSDLYSLGAILYELLTGRPPFLAESVQETLLKIRDVEPVSPRVLNRRIPQDLETICLKCLQKEPQRRYASAQELAEELGRFLHGEPILARPVGLAARSWRWCRRRPVLAGLAAVIVVLAILSTTVAIRMTLAQAERERELYRANVQLAAARLQEGSTDKALETLLACPPRLRHWEWGYLVGECHREALALEEACAPEVIEAFYSQIPPPRWRCGFSPDGQRVAATHPCGMIQVWEVPSGRPIWNLRESNEVEAGVAWLCDWSAVVLARSNVVEIVPVGSSGQRLQLTGHTQRIRRVAVASIGHQVAALATDDTLRVWNATNGQPLATFPVIPGAQRLFFTGDGHRLVVAAADQAATYDAQTGQELVRMIGGTENKIAVLPSPEAEQFLTIGADFQLRLWSTNALIYDLGLVQMIHMRETMYSSDRSRFLTTGLEASTAVRDSRTGQSLVMLPGRVEGAAFSPDGERLALRNGSSVIQVWDLPNRRESFRLKGHREAVHDVDFSPDGRLLVSVSAVGSVKVWSGLAGREILDSGIAWGMSLSSDGRRLAHAYLPDWVAVRDTQSGRLVTRLRRVHRQVLALTFRPDGKELATGDVFGQTALWEVETGRLRRVLSGHNHTVGYLTFSPDGRQLSTASWDGSVCVWDPETGQLLRKFSEPVGKAWGIVFSPDGRHMAVWDGNVTRIRSLETGQTEQELHGHSGTVWNAAFTPDSRRLATTSLDRTLRIWDVRSGKPLAGWNLRGFGGWLGFTPDGRRVALRVSQGVAFGTDAPTMEIWDVETGGQFLAFRGSIELGNIASFSADGRRLVTDWWDAKVRQWESFPWSDAEYPGGATQPVRERMRRYADAYWRDRLEAERQALNTSSMITVDVPFDRSVLPPRDPAAPSNLLDLTAYYTGPLDENGCLDKMGEFTGIDLGHAPRGLVRFDEVPFDARGILQLEPGIGNPFEWSGCPAAVDQIPVRQRFGRLHTVIGSVGQAPEGKAIGALVLHYADGSQHECEIHYGRHVRHWFTDEDSRTDTDLARVAWEGPHDFAKISPTRLRIYHAAWDNPHPDREVVSLDFVSRMNTTAAPFLVAVTVE